VKQNFITVVRIWNTWNRSTVQQRTEKSIVIWGWDEFWGRCQDSGRKLNTGHLDGNIRNTRYKM